MRNVYILLSTALVLLLLPSSSCGKRSISPEDRNNIKSTKLYVHFEQEEYIEELEKEITELEAEVSDLQERIDNILIHVNNADSYIDDAIIYEDLDYLDDAKK